MGKNEPQTALLAKCYVSRYSWLALTQPYSSLMQLRTVI